MQKGRDARARALTAALDDMDEWLCTGRVSRVPVLKLTSLSSFVLYMQDSVASPVSW